jgi:hypothetical protein
MAQRHHQESPIRTHHGTHSLCTPDHTHLHIPISRNTPPKCSRSTATGGGSHQTVSGTNHMHPNTLHPLLRRRQSLARRQKPEHLPPIRQIGTKMIWPFSRHGSSIPHVFPPEASPSMEDSQRIPRFPSHPLQRNHNPRSQLSGTTP